jgi:sterol desaturase/sphingolipid hydroxylase (fatty acid hydroxylase superfamily)
VLAGVLLILLIAVWLAGGQSASGVVDTIRHSVVARVAGLASGRIPEVMLLVSLVLSVEVTAVGWRNSSLFRLGVKRRRSAIVDILFYLVALLGLTRIVEIVLTLGLSVAASRLVNWMLAQYGWPRIELPSEGILPLAAGFGIYWLATTFVDYWGHRLMHVRWFWPLHRFHHAATELNVITVFRQHPVEPMILSFLVVVSPLVFFNVSDRILLLYFLWGTTFDLLAHSELPWGYGWFGRWIVASRRVHQIHHSIADEQRDLHFSKCPLWDHAFGTWYTGDKAPTEYGIPDNAYEVWPLRQFVYDALTFYAAAVRGLGASLARLGASTARRSQAAD